MPMDLSPNSDEARDIAYHFHSYTNARAHETKGPLIMDRGEGVHVFDSHGKKYIEVLITEEMIGHKFGEFSNTRKQFFFKKKKNKKINGPKNKSKHY